MSLLQLIQRAAAALSLPRPATVITATDRTTRQLLELANTEGEELARDGDWQVLRREDSFTTVAQEEQTSAIPDDWARWVNGSFWNRTRRLPLNGPFSEAAWQAMKAMQTSPLPLNFTIRNNAFLLHPTPTAGDTVAFGYYTTNWCASSGGTGQSAWAADTDVGVLPERLMRLGLIWRWKSAQGMAFDTDYSIYETAIQQYLAQQEPKGVVDLATGSRDRVPGVVVPDGDWNL